MLGIISFIALFSIKLIIITANIPDISGSESSTIHPIQRVVAGLPLYTNPENPPFLITQYTPLYFYIVGTTYRMCNFDPSNVHRIYTFSRVFSLGFLMLAIGVIFLTLQQILLARKDLSILVCLLVFHILSYWTMFSSRPDSLSFFLFTLFIFCVAKAFQVESRKNFYLNISILIAVVAFFCKQSGMIYPMIMGSYFLYFKEWKILIRLVLIGIFTFTTLALTLSLFDPVALFQNIIGGVVNSIHIRGWYGFTLKPLVLPFATFLTGGLAIGFKWIVFQKMNIKSFLGWAVIMLFIFDMLIALKDGSNVGYLGDFIYLSLLIIALYFSEYKTLEVTKRVLIAGISICTFAHCSVWVGMDYLTTDIERYTSLLTADQRISQYILENQKIKPNKYVYLGNFTRNYSMWYLRNFLFRHNIVAYEELNLVTYKNKVFNFNKFNDAIKSGALQFVIVEKGIAPDNLFKTPFERKNMNFRFKKTMDYVDIYENIKKAD